MPAKKAARKPSRSLPESKNGRARPKSKKGTKNGVRPKPPTGPVGRDALRGTGGRGISKALDAPSRSSSAVRSITPFLWFDSEFEEAAKFYVSLFPDSRIDGVNPMGGSFTLCGQKF